PTNSSRKTGSFDTRESRQEQTRYRYTEIVQQCLPLAIYNWALSDMSLRVPAGTRASMSGAHYSRSPNARQSSSNQCKDEPPNRKTTRQKRHFRTGVGFCPCSIHISG